MPDLNRRVVIHCAGSVINGPHDVFKNLLKTREQRAEKTQGGKQGEREEKRWDLGLTIKPVRDW